MQMKGQCDENKKKHRLVNVHKLQLITELVVYFGENDARMMILGSVAENSAGCFPSRFNIQTE